MAHINEKIDFTVALFVVQSGRVLVIHHRALNRWLPLGGHIELDEDPEQAALREAREESGLEVELVGERPPTTGPGTRALIAAVPRHPPHQPHARAHRHDLLGTPQGRRAGPGPRRAPRHPLVFRRRTRDPPAANVRCCKVVLPQSHRGTQLMLTQRQLKAGYFALEGLNSFGATYYFYYLYFFTQKSFGFDNKANLALAALNGAVYAVSAWWGGRFAERAGYFAALKTGFVIMLASLLAGLAVPSAAGQVLVMCGITIGTCFTWPALEALVTQGETRHGVQQMVGVYNVVWAATGALAYFSGGMILEFFGSKSLFLVPLAILTVQLSLTLWLERQAAAVPAAEAPTADDDVPEIVAHPVPGASRFLQMAWLANPLAYIGINTLVAVMPGVAGALSLSTMQAGFCCSVWCFARLGAFFLLWFWNGWHYRFRYLLGAYVLMLGTFAAILLIPKLWVLVLAQVGFGAALGLIYYSSLFYSMDQSDKKGEHGGIHEAAIGVGNLAGPAVGAASLQFLPQYSNSGALAVSGVLLLGLTGLLAIWKKGRR
jgi:predicted MFS family arabinose efflux permease/8-oxo-dGTP pyrophosphatase MutT (NUDIX family)